MNYKCKLVLQEQLTNQGPQGKAGKSPMNKYRRHSKKCMWRQRGHFYMVFYVYDSEVTRGTGEAHVALY